MFWCVSLSLLSEYHAIFPFDLLLKQEFKSDFLNGVELIILFLFLLLISSYIVN